MLELDDGRLTEYLDGSLPPAALAALEAELAADPALADSLEDARRGRALLDELTPMRPPRDFLRKVQRRVRRRSGGRYFHPVPQPFGYRISVEVFAVIAIAVMAACYFFLDAAPRGVGELTEVPPEAPVERPLP